MKKLFFILLFAASPVAAQTYDDLQQQMQVQQEQQRTYDMQRENAETNRRENEALIRSMQQPSQGQPDVQYVPYGNDPNPSPNVMR